MDMVKKNIVSIILGVVALVAVIAVYYPIGGYYEQLKKDGEARKAVYTSVKGLIDQPRHLPILDPDSAEPKPLDVYPVRSVIDAGQKLTTAVATSSKGLFDEVVKINEHRLLLPGSLPAPNPVTGINFITAYQRRVNPPQVPPARPEDRAGSLQQEVLRAGTPPNPTDITTAIADLKARISAERLVWDKGVAINQDAVNQEIASQVAALPEAMRQSAAANCLIYINPDSINVNPTIVGTSSPDPVNIWNAQSQLWVQEDICLAIRALNSQPVKTVDGKTEPPSDVRTAPVKHLFRLEVPPMFGSSGLAGMPPAPPPAADGSAPNNYAVSPTGRIANPLYDVMPFRLTVNIETTKIPALLAELTRNRLITVPPGRGDQPGRFGR